MRFYHICIIFTCIKLFHLKIRTHILVKSFLYNETFLFFIFVLSWSGRNKILIKAKSDSMSNNIYVLYHMGDKENVDM